jgi:DNA polymerase I-like protein with 3'-5' exonuclease and polymerase domains
MKKDFRKVIKPHNDWFISLDYNGAEVRTVIALLEREQPKRDIHTWNIEKVFAPRGMHKELTRDKAKTLFFGWLYNPDSTAIESEIYDRESILDKYYKNGYVSTIFDRKIEVDERRAFNYLIQSTTSDLVIDRALEIDKILRPTKSSVSHIVHDELVIDLADEDRPLIPEIKKVFSENKLAAFMVNLKAGKNYYDLEELKI